MDISHEIPQAHTRPLHAHTHKRYWSEQAVNIYPGRRTAYVQWSVKLFIPGKFISCDCCTHTEQQHKAKNRDVVLRSWRRTNTTKVILLSTGGETWNIYILKCSMHVNSLSGCKVLVYSPVFTSCYGFAVCICVPHVVCFKFVNFSPVTGFTCVLLIFLSCV